MSQRKLGICPKCGQDILIALLKYFRRDPVVMEFDFECPNCATGLDVEVEVQPLFWVSRPTEDALDGAKRPLVGHNGKPSNITADGSVLEPPRK